jgi:hypothetical protein
MGTFSEGNFGGQWQEGLGRGESAVSDDGIGEGTGAKTTLPWTPSMRAASMEAVRNATNHPKTTRRTPIETAFTSHLAATQTLLFWPSKMANFAQRPHG